MSAEICLYLYHNREICNIAAAKGSSLKVNNAKVKAHKEEQAIDVYLEVHTQNTYTQLYLLHRTIHI